MNVCWHLIWAVPLAVLIGIFASAYWPFGNGLEGPPFAGFTAEPKCGENLSISPETRDRQAEMYQVGIDFGYPTGIAYYKTGDPPGTYLVQPGSRLHQQVEAYHRYIIDSVPMPHLGPCGPQCWRKPDGHRWGDVH